jgi:hypothetical protein
MPLPTVAFTSKQLFEASPIPDEASASFTKSASLGPVIEDRFSPVAWRLILQVPHVFGGVASATILEATVPGGFDPKKVP